MRSLSPTLLRQLAPSGNKTQLIRLLDVFLFGPLMIAAAADQDSKYFRTALLLVGLGTIVYNGANYLQTAQQQKEASRGTVSRDTIAGSNATLAGLRRAEGMTLH